MTTHPLEMLIIKYLAEKDITIGTYELYKIVLNQYVSYLKEHEIAFATTKDIEKYRQILRNQSYSSSWIYNQICALKGLYLYLSENQKRLNLPEPYAYNIMEFFKNEQIIQKVKKPVLTIEQAKHLINYTKDNRKYIWHYRDHAMVYLMLTTGLRSIEIRRAKRKDLKMVGNQLILFIQGKGRDSKDEYVKIPEGLEIALNDYLKRRMDKNPYLFIAYRHRTKKLYLSRTFFNTMFTRILKDCGLENIHMTAHSLRHTAATFNLMRGGSLESTRQFMRHKEMATTLIYAHHLEWMKDDSENQVESYILGDSLPLEEGDF